MPINRIKDRQGRTRFEFEFSRRLNGQRVRIRKSLPLGWNRAQADAFDRAECSRLYAVASGTEKPVHKIEEAVARYFRERIPDLKHGSGQAREIYMMATYFQGRPLTELPAVCAEYLQEHRDKLAPATVKNRLRYLVAACRWGWKRHSMCEHDPGAAVIYPAVNNARQHHITREQMIRLAKGCEHRAVRALIRIAFYSGMRQGEILAAKVQGGYWTLPDSKNGDPVRVPVHPRVRCCLRYKWPTRYIVGYWFRRARELAGMPELHFHDIRHSTATELLRQGENLGTVGAVLRHKSVASTKRYAHYTTDLVEAAIGKLGKRRA